MINNVALVGRLTKDPVVAYTASKVAYVRFTLAVSRKFSNANGDKETDFINCMAWRGKAENLAKFQKKGSLIGVLGRIETGSYDGQDGKKVYTTTVVADDIQFLETKKQSDNRQTTGGYEPPPENEYDPFNGGSGPIEVSDQDLPF